MKKGTKALKGFNHVELGQIYQAMQLHRFMLNSIDQKQFDIPFKQIASQQDLHSCRQIKFDGLEMKLISEALRSRGRFLIKQKHYLASVKYFELAQAIEEELYQFQSENGPKIKAASAGTLTATAQIAN